MLKELLLTIILGTIFGFGLTGGFFAIKKSSKTQPSVTPTSAQNVTLPISSTQPSSSTPTIFQNIENNHQISIESPENEAIVNNSKIKIRGSTTPKSIVVIKTPIKTYSLEADENGQFSSEISIETGVNIIQASSFDPLDNQADTQIIVTYSTAKI